MTKIYAPVMFSNYVDVLVDAYMPITLTNMSNSHV